MPEPGAGSGGARGGSGMGAGDPGGNGRERDDSGRIADRIGYGVDLGGVESEGHYEPGREGGWITGRTVRPGGLIETYLEDIAPSVAPVTSVSSPAYKTYPVEFKESTTPLAGIKFDPVSPVQPVETSSMGEVDLGFGGHPGMRTTSEDYFGVSPSDEPLSDTPDQPTQSLGQFDIEAKKQALRNNPNMIGSRPVMVDIVSKTFGINKNTLNKASPELLAALTIGKGNKLAKARIEPSALGKRVGASYTHAQIDPLTGKPRPGTDLIRLGKNYTAGDVVHELGHRLAMEASRLGILDKISMPGVQALFETGGSATTPGYGAQGEMVSSRAGTAQNLVDALDLRSKGWQDYGWYNPKEDEFEMDYWGTMTDVHPTAAKGGWTGNTRKAGNTYEYSPDKMKGAFSPSAVPDVISYGEWGEGGMPLVDTGWWGGYTGANVAYPSQDYTGVTRPVSPDQAHSNTVPGGGGGFKEGYQNLMNYQKEMPPTHYGGAYTDLDSIGLYGDWTNDQLKDSLGITDEAFWTGKVPFGPSAVTVGDPNNPNKHGQGGLLNWPAQGHHGLIQEFMLRNKNILPGEGDIPQAEYNQMIAISEASPDSKIHLTEKYNLPTNFWDKLDAYLAQNPSEYSPAGSKATLEKTVMNMDQ